MASKKAGGTAKNLRDSSPKDHTLFALKDGTVKFTQKRRVKFNNQTSKRKFINIV